MLGRSVVKNPSVLASLQYQTDLSALAGQNVKIRTVE